MERETGTIVADGKLLEVVRQLELKSVEEDLAAMAANVLSDGDIDYLPAHRRRVEAYNEALDLFAAIENHPATTIEGLKAKARAIDWHNNHFFNQLARGHRQAPQCPLVKDLLAL
jgi:hypothetical protein